jgi:hypothetical protein
MDFDYLIGALTTFWRWTTHDAVAAYTAVLAISTIALWIVTARGIRNQRRDTEILQRAYVSVEPGEISSTTVGRPLAHVDFKNVGHLPASDFQWFLELTPSNDEHFRPPEIADDKLRAAGVLPIGTRIRRGSPDVRVATEKFLYAWGRVTYSDGFGNCRFTNFCHRYNTARREASTDANYLVRDTYARHHDLGNSAD